MWNGTWHSYTVKMAIKGELKVLPYVAMSDNDATSRFWCKYFEQEERNNVIDAYELTNDETGEVLMKRYSLDILDYI